MPTISDINPLSNFSVGGFSKIGSIGLIIVIVLVILGMGGFLIWFIMNKKRYKYVIPLYRKIGNQVIRVGFYRARDFPIGKAGDTLWFVAKAKKYIAPATLQTGKNEYPHYVREDGEWINFDMPDIDDQMKKADVHYIHQDMRSQRIAISQLLEQRLMQKGFWEKWGVVIGYVIFFMIITVAMIIIFYQWSNIADKVALMLDRLMAHEEKMYKLQGGDSLVPALVSMVIWKFKK